MSYSDIYAFLDIDGVLNTQEHSSFLPSAMYNIKTLYQKTQCKFIISSDWRLNKSLDDLQKLFIDEDLDIPLVGKTEDGPSVFGEYRANQIKNYIDVHQIEKYIVIDDVNYRNFRNYFGERFIQASFTQGFTRKNLEHALNIMNKL